jgi:hypothetical protein
MMARPRTQPGYARWWVASIFYPEGDGGEPPRQAQGKEAEHSTGPAGCSLRETLVRAGLQLWEKLFYPR